MSYKSQQYSRRQLLSKGVDSSLGFMLLPQMSIWGKGSTLRERTSLLALVTTSVSTTVRETPITAIIHFTSKPNQVEALVAQLNQALPSARKAPGCRYAKLYIVADTPSKIVLCKGWDGRQAQDQYLKWEQSSGRLAKLLALVEGEPMVEYWDFQAM